MNSMAGIMPRPGNMKLPSLMMLTPPPVSIVPVRVRLEFESDPKWHARRSPQAR